MQQFTTIPQVQQARLPPVLRKIVFRSLLALIEAYEEYDPEDDGHVVLVDHTTTDAHAVELFGVPWREARLEGVIYDAEARAFETCVLFNNHFGITVIVPDRPWLDPAFRAKLVNELVNMPTR